MTSLCFADVFLEWKRALRHLLVEKNPSEKANSRRAREGWSPQIKRGPGFCRPHRSTEQPLTFPRGGRGRAGAGAVPSSLPVPPALQLHGGLGRKDHARPCRQRSLHGGRVPQARTQAVEGKSEESPGQGCERTGVALLPTGQEGAPAPGSKGSRGGARAGRGVWWAGPAARWGTCRSAACWSVLSLPEGAAPCRNSTEAGPLGYAAAQPAPRWAPSPGSAGPGTAPGGQGQCPTPCLGTAPRAATNHTHTRMGWVTDWKNQWAHTSCPSEEWGGVLER